MTKVEKIKQKAIEYGFSKKFIDYIKVEFSNNGYGYDSKLGKYLPVQKKIILYDECIENIFPTYLHEIVHALQNIELERRFGKIVGCLLYWIALTFLRKKIEDDADEIEDRIYAIYESLASQPIEKGTKDEI